MSTQAKQIYEFGPFRIDTAERVLLRDGNPVPLTPKAYEVLLLLVERSGHIVEKEELLDRVWADSFVEEGNLKVTVSVLRKALEGSGSDNQFIETVPRRGYRFVERVTELAAESAELLMHEVTRATVTIEQEEQKPRALPGKGNRLGVRWAIASMALIGLIIAGFYLLANRTKPSNAKVRSIAVLPFKPVVASSRDEALEIGMADTLITRLGNIKQIIVRPTSAVRNYGGLDQDATAAGREQKVDVVLDGNIQKSGEQIRVTVRLINVVNSQQLWADKFDERFTDIFKLQDSISTKVAAVLALRLTSEDMQSLTKHHTTNAEAYEAYLRGRYYAGKFTRDGFDKGIEYINQAIAIDPTYALAYEALAYYYFSVSEWLMSPKEAMPRAKEAANEALKLDDTLAEAHTWLATVSYWYDRDWSLAELEYARAIELNPNYATAHQYYGQLLVLLGRLEEGIAEGKRAQELEPLSLEISAWLAQSLYLARRYNEASEQLRKIIDMDPNYWFAYLFLGRTLEQTGQLDEMMAAFQKGRRIENDNAELLAHLGRAYAVRGKRREAQATIAELNERSKRSYVAPYFIAKIYMGLGDKNQALEWLEKAYQERSFFVTWLNVDPELTTLRSDARFADLLRRIGIPRPAQPQG